MMSEEGKQVKTQVFTLGEIILKLKMPENFVEAVNKAIDERGDSMPDWNPQLAGKIKKEKLLNPILNDDIKGTFMMCFQEYMKRSGSVLVNTHQYNPAHFHSSKNSLVGLSSVLFLKVPDTYGEEYTNNHEPANGHLEFIGGNQHSLSMTQMRISPKVGDFFIFPYTLVHAVYPFRQTEEMRRTLSYNCDILPKVLVKPA